MGSLVAHAPIALRHAQSIGDHRETFARQLPRSRRDDVRLRRWPGLLAVDAPNRQRHLPDISRYGGAAPSYGPSTTDDRSHGYPDPPCLTRNPPLLGNHASCPEGYAVYIITTLGTSRLHERATVMHSRCRRRHSPCRADHVAPVAHSATFMVAHDGICPPNAASSTAHDRLSSVTRQLSNNTSFDPTDPHRSPRFTHNPSRRPVVTPSPTLHPGPSLA